MAPRNSNNFPVNQEEFEDIKVVIRIRISKKNRQHNGQENKQRFTKHTHKIKDRVTLTPLKTGGQIKLGAYTAGKASFLSIIGALVTG